MTAHPSRRDLLAAASAAAAACDQVIVDETPDFDLNTTSDGSGIAHVTATDDFYVYYCCTEPPITAESWSLTIRDRGVDLVTLDADWLAAQVPRDLELTLECIGSSTRSQLISNARWRGRKLVDIFADLGIAIDPSIVGIRLVGWDDYDAVIPIEDLEGAPIWAVWEMNGEPLTAEHGFPTRLLVPGRYGVKNVKWIQAIELHSEEVTDFWTTRGWSEAAVYKANGYILAPAFGAQYPSGEKIKFVGTGFAGKDPVVRVEISWDGWKTSDECALDYAPGANVWALWYYVWDPPSDGTFQVQIRVTTASGAQSGLNPFGTNPLAGYDGGQSVEIEVG
jgi:DMSO/TMAO reductase YedYZ molybdopterin-dependent catalytic subunit